MANWQNGVTPLNEENINALYDLRIGGTNIVSGTDLNNITTPGTYRCQDATVAKTLLNCPYQGAFKLVVEYLHATTRIRQTIYANAVTSDTYVRTYSVGEVWGDWIMDSEWTNISTNVTATSNFTEVDKRIYVNKKTKLCYVDLVVTANSAGSGSTDFVSSLPKALSSLPIAGYNYTQQKQFWVWVGTAGNLRTGTAYNSNDSLRFFGCYPYTAL